MGPLLIKPAEMMLFYTGADTFLCHGRPKVRKNKQSHAKAPSRKDREE
jgi:hypothetical protein